MVRGAVDGLVLADVHVVGLRIELEVGHVGHVGEVLVLGRGHAARLAVELRLFPGLLRPGAGHDVVGLLVLHEVHRDGRELLGGAALQEEHLVVVGNLQELAQVGLGRLDDVREGLGAVAHLHDGHAGAVVVEHLGGRLAQHLLGKHSGTGGKVVDPSHEAILLRRAPEAPATTPMRPALYHAPSSRQLPGHCNPICEPRPQHKSRAVRRRRIHALAKIFPQLVTKSSSGFCFSVEYTFFVYFNGHSTSFEPDFGRMVKQLS